MSPAATPFQMMERVGIQPSPLNPRKHFDEAKLQELAASMGNGIGIIEPLVVRPRPDLNCHELVAGERRWRAAAIASLDEVPVVVKEMTDAQVLEVMVIENNQREDITPLEEASGFKQLLALGAVDVDTLAGRLGRSRKYVYDRIKLLALVPAAQLLLEQGRITAGHAILLARLTPEQQAAAIDPTNAADYDQAGLFECDNARFAGPDEPTKGKKVDPYARLKLASVRSFQEWIHDHVRLNVGDVETQQEFPELVAAIEKAVAVVHISLGYGWETDEASPDGGPAIYGADAWKRADGKQSSKKCDHAVTGVVVVGRGRGTAFTVCVEKACKAHWPPAPKVARSSRGSSKKREPTAAEKRWKAEQQREQLARQVWEKAAPDIIAACAARIGKAKPEVLGELILESDFIETDDLKKADALLPVRKKVDAAAVLERLALAALIDQVERSYSHKALAGDLKKQLGVDVAPILKRVQTSAKADAKATVKKKAAAA